MKRGQATKELRQAILHYLKAHPKETFSLSPKDKQKLASKIKLKSVNPNTIGWILWRLRKDGILTNTKES